jgi:phage-related baseplate assembly protein
VAEIDLSRLPPPDVVEPLDYESILASMTGDFAARHPEFSAWVESDPGLKLLEAAAYREFLLRARINDAARAVMLATAAGPDLDNLAALLGVERGPAETDDRLRRRTQLSLEALTTAGSAKSYIGHALAADPSVADASAVSPAPGDVLVTVLGGGEHGDGAAPAALVAAVREALSGETVRPLSDTLTVQSAVIIPFAVDAAIEVADGPDSTVVVDAARAAVEGYCREQHRLGGTIARSGIFAALHRAGVSRATLAAPARDVLCTSAQAPWPTADATAPYSAPHSHEFGGIAVAAA